MATPAEQNLVTEIPQENEVKVIVIKLPFDLQERLLSFPLLHQLHEKYPEADFHFITPKKQIEVLNLLPFSAFYHEFDEDEIASVLDVHPYTANAKINNNVDLFISLTNSFVDACLGIGLRAKKRLGFSDGWKTLLLTHKTPRPVGHHVCEDFLSLYNALFSSNFPPIKVRSRELVPVFADWAEVPYIAINLSPVRHAGVEEELVELINQFEEQKIVLFSSDDQEKVQLVIEPFLKLLSKKNTYVNFVHKNWIELAKMLAFSKGVITFNGPCASMASYVGAKLVVLYDSEDPQKHGPMYFLSDSLLLNVNDPTLALQTANTGPVKDRKRFNMDEVYGRAIRYFKL